MIHIKKRHPSKKLMEEVTSLKAEDGWKRATCKDTEVLRDYFDRLDKKLIRKELCQEQHYLCAYCMRRIHEDTTMVIEHWHPISDEVDVNWDKNLALDYHNMLGCCDGGRKNVDEHKVLCCDASKKNRSIKFSPLKKEHVDKIIYKTNGRIATKPVDSELEYDINDVLHLNGIINSNGEIEDTSTGLVIGRQMVYKNYVDYMRLLGKKLNNNKERMLNEIQKKIAELEGGEEYLEFVGAWLFFLRRRIKRCV